MRDRRTNRFGVAALLVVLSDVDLLAPLRADLKATAGRLVSGIVKMELDMRADQQSYVQS